MTKRHNVRVGSRTPQNGALAAATFRPSRSSAAPAGFHPTWVPSASSHPTNPILHTRPALSFLATIFCPLNTISSLTSHHSKRPELNCDWLAFSLSPRERAGVRGNATSDVKDAFINWKRSHSALRTHFDLLPMGEGALSPSRSSLPSAATPRTPTLRAAPSPSGTGPTQHTINSPTLNFKL